MSQGCVDIHNHAISTSLPSLGDRYDYGHWPSVECSSDTEGTILVGGKWFRAIDDRCWSGPRRIRDMDAEGVAIQVVSPVPITFCYDAPAEGAAELARAQNEFFADMVQSAPDRFRAFAAIPMQDVDLAVKELERCMADASFVGAEIGTTIDVLPLGDRGLLPFYEAAADLSAALFVHPAHIASAERLAPLDLVFGIGMPTETAFAAASLLVSGIIDDVPGLDICLAHGGGALPQILPRVDQGWRISERDDLCSEVPGTYAPRLFCDSLTYDADSLELCVKRFGAGHVMVGTDYPFAARELPTGKVLQDLADKEVDPDLVLDIESHNAAALFRLADVPRRSTDPRG